MLYPKNFEEKLNFDKIRKIINDNCLSSLGVRYVEKMRFSTDFDKIEKWQKQTSEFKKIIDQQEPFPANNYIDALQHLPKGQVPGSFYSEEDLFDIALSLKTIIAALSFLKKRREDYPVLFELASNIEVDAALIDAIEKIVDEKGQIKDNASPELSSIRSRIRKQESQLRSTVQSILKNAISKGYTEEGVTVALRNGRMVIPVNAASKRQLKGYIQDQSSTGQTVFIEPAESIEISNEVKELEYQQRREIIRLLTLVTDAIRPYIDDLKKAYNFLGIIDFVRAKAKLAIQLQANQVYLKNESMVKWYDARHPLLYLAHSKVGKKVVPLTIEISHEQRILVISGPNAGGKSVTLKTLGLLQYMFQCGLMVPAGEGSTMGIYKKIFIDIGDEQSIENDLSTYSSHLTNMKHFAIRADKQTLFLIDEFGTGTEPQIGGAIAESILMELNKALAQGVVTTHYGNLKKYADENEGLVNAAMRFDVDQLEPLYQLEVGKPGSSFALEIAQKIGLPRKILQQAKSSVGYEQIKFEKLLSQLEWDKKQQDERWQNLKEEERKLQKELTQYKHLSEILENNKKKIINDAKEQAKNLLKEANQKVEKTIRDIKENKAEKEVTKKLRKDLEDYKKNIGEKETVKEPEETTYEVVPGEINVGDWVRLKGQTAVGKVVDKKGKNLEIIIGNLTSKIKTNRLEKVSSKEARKTTRETSAPTSRMGVNINQKMANFSAILDIRGQRAEQALPKVDEMMDDALMLGYRDLKIVHGKGDGILRQVIRDHLRRNYKYIKKLADEHADRGGSGVTLVELK